ncbi:Spn1, transposase Orf2 [Streptococcus pneumoniae]|nr:Spn1, transposase Orf2 [Streptococcus pneumoniae]
MVAGLTNGELIAPMTYEETMTSDFFEAWFQKFLLPTLTTPSVIIVLIAPMTYEETMTSDFFEAWFQKFLLPTLTTPSVIIVK